MTERWVEVTYGAIRGANLKTEMRDMHITQLLCLVTVAVVRVTVAGSPEQAATTATFAVVATLAETVAAQVQALVVLRAVRATVAFDQGVAANTHELAQLAELIRFFVRQADAVVHLTFELSDAWVPRWGGKDSGSGYDSGQKSDLIKLHHVGSNFCIWVIIMAWMSVRCGHKYVKIG